MSNPYEADMLTIRYEDLITEGVRELQRFCEFVGVDREPAVLQAAISNAGFEQMRDIELRYGTIYHPEWDRKQRFFRRGQAGSFVDEMPTEVLEAFMERAGATLRRMEYVSTVQETS